MEWEDKSWEQKGKVCKKLRIWLRIGTSSEDGCIHPALERDRKRINGNNIISLKLNINLKLVEQLIE